MVWIILAGAALTYLSRSVAISCCRASSGCIRGSRRALDAVPAAVLTTLVAPALVSAGPAELAALLSPASWRCVAV